jgi:hypothetical protein
MRPLELGLIAGSLCLFFFVNAKEGGRGPDGSYWDLRASESSADARLALEIRKPGQRWRSENPRPWSSFHGIDAEALRRSGPVKFEYVADAGTLHAEGASDGRRAKGTFTFKADPAFKEALRTAGYALPSDESVFEMMMHGITREFAQGVRAAGLEANLRDLTELAVHGVKLELIQETRALGFARLSVRDLIDLRIHGVSPELMKAVKNAGYDMPVREIVELRIHGVTPEYLAGLRASGLRPAAKELVEMRIHDVSPDYLAGLAQAGYGRLNTREIVDLRLHGVGPDLVRQARSLGYDFTARELIEMRNHGVDGGYLDKLASSGFKKLSAQQIIKLRTHGID